MLGAGGHGRRGTDGLTRGGDRALSPWLTSRHPGGPTARKDEPAHPGPSEVADVLRAYGEADPVALTALDVTEMRAAAAPLREVFAAGHVDEAAATLNRLLREHTGPIRLTSHGGGTPWHPHLDHDDDAPWGAWLLASSCMALSVLLWDRQRPPGGTCASAGCHNVFITQGSGPERRYCSRRCVTRERVAAHRRSRSGEAG